MFILAMTTKRMHSILMTIQYILKEMRQVVLGLKEGVGCGGRVGSGMGENGLVCWMEAVFGTGDGGSGMNLN